jgi:hypothetical protein
LLEALAELCLHPDLFEILVLRLLARLDETLAISVPARTGSHATDLDESPSSAAGKVVGKMTIALSRRLLARLDETLAISVPARTSEYTAATLYAHHVLATLRAVIQQKIKQGHVDVAKYVETLVRTREHGRVLGFNSLYDQVHDAPNIEYEPRIACYRS